MTYLESGRDRVYRKLKISGPVKFYRPTYFAGCYLITNVAALKLLSLEEKVVFAADRLHNQARIKKELNVKLFCPLLVSQQRQEFGSSILGVKSIKY